ncbi:helix-turn-helix domain-containing protein [Acidobacterium sp. S8]|uniref:helix-turn-helix domain-containing protein n=1 Tax=Acidobacterium sp. S8 TaxID=1641854 RepID=UPI00131CBFB3|nr:helix-turn-helix domain-containing protein [Acidobacterium sp. S8]
MNFSQLHEQLRRELLRRIARGSLSGTLLARQTGLKAAHISNFLHSKRRLSLDALDRVLSAQSIDIEDLLGHSAAGTTDSPKKSLSPANRVALVSQSVAMNESEIRPSSILELIELPSGYLDHLRVRRSHDRRTWERFVAVRASYSQAEPMTPAIMPHAILILDRHYNSLVPYRPPVPAIYAVRFNNAMQFRYATLHGNSIILRPRAFEHPIDLIEIESEDRRPDVIIGRVCASISEI